MCNAPYWKIVIARSCSLCKIRNWVNYSKRTSRNFSWKMEAKHLEINLENQKSPRQTFHFRFERGEVYQVFGVNEHRRIFSLTSLDTNPILRIIFIDDENWINKFLRVNDDVELKGLKEANAQRNMHDSLLHHFHYSFLAQSSCSMLN